MAAHRAQRNIRKASGDCWRPACLAVVAVSWGCRCVLVWGSLGLLRLPLASACGDASEDLLTYTCGKSPAQSSCHEGAGA